MIAEAAKRVLAPPVVRGSALPVQLKTMENQKIGWKHCNVTLRPHPPSRKHFCAPTNSCSHKPGMGGLWTSSALTPDLGSAWEQWRLVEKFGGTDISAWTLRASPEARLVKIDSFADLSTWVDAYGMLNPYGSLLAQIDFELMAEDGWDGVWLTENGQGATRYTTPGLYGWDCESVLWLRWAFVGAAKPVAVTWLAGWGEGDE